MKLIKLLFIIIFFIIIFSDSYSQSADSVRLLWNYVEQPLSTRMEYGASPAIKDLGPDVNNFGGEPNNYLEIITGSDEYANFFPELNSYAYGLWRCFDALGNLEWAKDTKSDEARSSVAIADINNDLLYEIAGGTTSGWCVEVMNRFGSWTPGISDAAWTFPYFPERNGSFMWHSSPALADIITGPHHEGLEVIIGNNPLQSVWAFDGDNSDGVDDGITVDMTTWAYPGPTGTEGVDWDVLWVFQTNGSIIASPAVGDIDNDGVKDVLVGSKDHNFYCINGVTGLLEWSLTTGLEITGSAGLADFNNDNRLEVIFGSQDGNVYFIKGDLNNNGILETNEYTYYTTGAAVFSSPAIADVDGDGSLEIIIGSDDGKIYCFAYNVNNNSVSVKWFYQTGNTVRSSPAVANSGRSTLTIYAGSTDGNLYLLDGLGNLITSYQTNGSIVTSPAIADINGDGKLEIAFTIWSSPDVFVVLKDYGSNVTPFAEPWPMFRHDPSHTGLYNWNPVVYANDIGIAEIIHPEGSILQNSSIIPQVIMHNDGENQQSSCTVTFEIRNSSNSLIYTNTQTVTNVPADSNRIVSFTPLTATAGYFHTKAYTSLNGDQDNDDNMKEGHYIVLQPQWTLDFESDNGGFEPIPTTNGWQWGTPTVGPTSAHSGTKVWGTNLTGNYDNNASWTLTSSTFIAQQDNPVLSFWHWYNIEEYRDGGNLKISVNGGTNTLIIPFEGYPGIATWNNFGIPDEPCWNGTSGGWLLTTFVLPVTNNQTFRLTWHFGSDNINTLPGWYIDDIMGFGFTTVSVVPLLLYPTNNSTNLDPNVTFVWSSVPYTVYYNLEVATDPNFNNLVINQSGITTTSYTVPNPLANGTTYYWRVNSFDGNQPSSWSTIWHFTTTSGGIQPPPSSWNFVFETDKSAEIAIPVSIPMTIGSRSFMLGDAIGAFFTGDDGNLHCAGYVVWQGNSTQFVVWSDNPDTPVKEGFYLGEIYTIKVWDAQVGVDYIANVTYTSGPDNFQPDAISVLGSISAISEIYFDIPLTSGWNLVSSNVNPLDPTLSNIFAPMGTNFLLAKDYIGNVYWPEWGIDDIGFWDVTQGYQVYVINPDILSIYGDLVNPRNVPINLNQGWYIISYLRNSIMTPDIALSSIQGNFLILKDNLGNVYWPDWGIDDIGNMVPGQGYQIYMSLPAVLLYPAN